MLQKLIAMTLSIAIVGVMVAAFSSGNLGATVVAQGTSPTMGAIEQRPIAPAPAALDEAAVLPQAPAQPAPEVTAPAPKAARQAPQATAPAPKLVQPVPQAAESAPVVRPEAEIVVPAAEIVVPAPENVAAAPAPEAAEQ